MNHLTLPMIGLLLICLVIAGSVDAAPKKRSSTAHKPKTSICSCTCSNVKFSCFEKTCKQACESVCKKFSCPLTLKDVKNIEELEHEFEVRSDLGLGNVSPTTEVIENTNDATEDEDKTEEEEDKIEDHDEAEEKKTAIEPTKSTIKPTETTVKPTKSTTKPTKTTEKSRRTTSTPIQSTVKPAESTSKPLTNSSSTNFNYNEAILHFTQNMFAEISKDHGNNFVFSPLSLHMALSILASGGKYNTATKKELLGALGYKEKNRVKLLMSSETTYLNIMKNYTDSELKALTVANGLWVRTSKVNVKDKYKDLLKQSYGAEIFKLSSKKDAALEINEWVKKSTNGKIEKIVDSIDSEAIMFLANAVFFNESWAVPFDELPEPLNFTLPNGEVKKVKMMDRTSRNIETTTLTLDKVLPGVSVTLVTLKYSTEYGRFRMVIVMPEKLDGLDRIEDYLTNNEKQEREEIISSILEAGKSINLDSIERTLTMPLFSVKSQLQVEKYLRRLGVNAAFDVGEFDKISDQPLKLGSVNHVATIDVTLEGTLGAAASGFELTPYSLSIAPSVNVMIDKPFSFFITDHNLDTIIFAGRIRDPTHDGSDPRD